MDAIGWLMSHGYSAEEKEDFFFWASLSLKETTEALTRC